MQQFINVLRYNIMESNVITTVTTDLRDNTSLSALEILSVDRYIVWTYKRKTISIRDNAYLDGNPG